MHSELVAQRVKQFDLEHGDDPVRIGFYYHFRDGAMREVNVMGRLMDPPEDGYERDKLIVRYWQARVDQAVKNFDRKKTELRQRAEYVLEEASRPNGIPPAPPDEEDLAALKVLQNVVKRLHRKLDAAKARIQEVESGPASADEEVAECIRDAAQSALADINKIEV
jgi:hypothetical protein